MRARQLVRVSVGAWGFTISQALLGLITTPFLVHHLGAARYGIFAVIGIVSLYLSNVEIGFGQATMRFLARARAAADAEEEDHVLTTSLAVFAIGGAAATAVALLGSSFIADRFVHGDARGDEALDAIRLGALTLLGSLISSFASVSLQALSQFALLLRLRTIFGTLSSVGSVGTVLAGGGLRDVLVVQLTVNTGLTLTLFRGLSRSTATRLIPRIHRGTFVLMARYGVAVLVAGVGFQVLLQGPPSVLAGYATTDQVAAYAVPAMIMQQLLMLLGSASFAFGPFASAQSISDDRTRLAEIFRANVRFNVLVGAPVASFLVFLGKPLLIAWIGSRFANDAFGPLRFLVFAALVLALSAPPADVLRGLGKPGWVAIYTVGTAALTLGGAFALVQSHGAAGVAAALALGLTCGTAVLLVVVPDRLLRISAVDLVRALIGPVVAVSGVAVMYAIGAALTSGVAGTIATGLVITTIYAIAAHRWVLDPRERVALSGLLPDRRRHQPASD